MVPEQVRDLPRAFLPEAVPVPQARRVWINRVYLEKFGFTPECSKCRAIQAGDISRASLAHSRDCRERIEECLRQDPLLSRHVANADERQDDYLARQVEAGERAAKRGRNGGDVVLEPEPERSSTRANQPELTSPKEEPARVNHQPKSHFAAWQRRACARFTRSKAAADRPPVISLLERPRQYFAASNIASLSSSDLHHLSSGHRTACSSASTCGYT